MMTQERLTALASALIDLALDLTDDPVRIESYLRSLGFTDEELRLLGFELASSPLRRRAFLLPSRSAIG